jgi:hypothetical protein
MDDMWDAYESPKSLARAVSALILDPNNSVKVHTRTRTRCSRC